MLLDARVLDDRGQAIRELGASDFEVTIGGKAARVESVLWVTGSDEELPPLESGEFRSSFEPASGRLIVFVFQKSLESGRIAGLMRMLREAHGILDTLTANDRVAVLSFDSHLRIWLDFTNDFARVRRVFERGILFERARAAQESSGPSLRQRLGTERAKKTYTIEGALRRLGQAIEDLPGAKSVILVGHGFGRFSRHGVTMENEYGEAREALQAARASVFCLDVTEADYHSLEAGLQFVAEDTGGFFARTHLFPERALARLVGALAGHYVLFVEQPPLSRGAHGIDVTLTGRKGNVLVRSSYFARTTTKVEAHPARNSDDGGDASCGATRPTDPPFVPPPPYPGKTPSPDVFWHGTSQLWTMLPVDGTWRSLQRGDSGLRQKVFLWHPGYDGRSNQWPEANVTGHRRNHEASLQAEQATNAYRRDFGGWTLLVGVELPEPGCWDLEATFEDETLRFTVFVAR